MSAIIPENIKEEIRERSDIVEVIGGYLPLQRAGGAYKTTCPFHKEKTASFMVNPQRQSYRCFGCGASGDVFKFIQQFEGLDFPSSLARLADRAGINLERFESEEVNQRKPLYEALAAANQLYQEAFWGSQGQQARDYILGKRGITRETAEKFQLGFAPASWDFITLGLGKRFEREILVQAGLTAQIEKEGSREQRFYDRFRNRLIFPIQHESGKLIAFSGRTMETGNNPAKYINSPETPLYRKGSVFYALDKAKRAIYDKDQGIIEEGPIDVIRSHQEGHDNVIGCCGTAFTEEHMTLLTKRFPGIEFLICFDGDKAGGHAASRLASNFLGRGNFNICLLPEKQDPASIFESGRSLTPYLDDKRPAFDYLLDYITTERKLDITTPEGICSLLTELKEPFKKAPETSRNMLLDILSKRLCLRQESVTDWFFGTSREEQVFYGSRRELKELANDFLKLLVADKRTSTVEYFASMKAERLLPDIHQKYLFNFLRTHTTQHNLALNGTDMFGGQTRDNIVNEIVQLAKTKGDILNPKYLYYLFQPTRREEMGRYELKMRALEAEARKRLEKRLNRYQEPRMEDLERVFLSMRLAQATFLLRNAGSNKDNEDLERIITDIERTLGEKVGEKKPE